ncbi:type II toxin-antitoxin system VapC family toxin [Pseudoduganella lutea]|uniref:PIN domain-containing protein n=1 Tax=Pseudoduganella lutea TaxID=321985 RepID=A0A4P6L462_9BURK|nr:PIN domain-containing protein [Pseudoduganella lutea]QBE65638.1 PIN domain-containing protein [Pseudoduganella lutea]
MSSVLVDTSVWVDHFRYRNEILVGLLAQDNALTHPMVITELACGTPPAPRLQTLRDIGMLQYVRQATLEEVRELIERAGLYGQGCGLVDIALLASTLMTPGTVLWTNDRRLGILAEKLGIAFRQVSH